MLNATVVSRKDVTDSLLILGVKPDHEIPDFQAGQYVALGMFGSAPRLAGCAPDPEVVAAEKLVKRTYSIGSSPYQKDAIEFYIAVVREGLLTPRLALLKEGDRVYIAPKITGKFVLSDVPADRNLVFVSTGTGIAPFISMLRSPSTWEHPERKVTLLQGIRYPQDLAYSEELAELAKSRSNFSFRFTVSRPNDDWAGDRGYVQTYFKNGAVAVQPENDHVFLCGNPAMVNDVESMLCGQGYIVHSNKTPGSLHLEKYW